MKESVTIGDLAKAVGISRGALRYYESIGLIPEPQRSESGYRLYSDAHVRRARLLKQARELGLNLRQTEVLLTSASRDGCTSFQDRLIGLVATKIDELDQRIAELKALRGKLRRLRTRLGSETRQIPVTTLPALESSHCSCLDEISRASN